MLLNIDTAVDIKHDGTKKLNRIRFLEALVNSNLFVNFQGTLYILDDDCFVSPLCGSKSTLLLRKHFSNDDNVIITNGLLKDTIKTLSELPCLNIKELNPPDYICLQNGLFSVHDGQLHSSVSNERKFFSFKIDAKFDPNATLETAPVFSNFLKDTFQADEDSILLLQQILGFTLTNIRTFKGAFFLIGVSGAGKSVLARFLRAVLPNTSALSLQELSDKFRLAMLKNASANICEEISSNKVTGFDVFKRISSGDSIIIERKNAEPETFISTAHLLYCGNFLPPLADADPLAILERIKLLYFGNSITADRRDPYLLEKLLAEKDTIVSWALASVPRLVKSKFQFATPQIANDYLERYAIEVNSVSKFLKDCIRIEEDTNKKLHTKTLLSLYHAFCLRNAVQPQSDQELKSAIGTLPGVLYSKFRIDGSAPAYGYKGLSVISPQNEEATE